MNEIHTVNEQWLCVVCRFLIGYVEDKTTIRIKRRDLFVEIKGGEDQVTVICPRCGKHNIIGDENSVRKEGT